MHNWFRKGLMVSLAVLYFVGVPVIQLEFVLGFILCAFVLDLIYTIEESGGKA